MNMFNNEDYQKSNKAYETISDAGSYAELREAYKRTQGITLRTVVPLNTKYPIQLNNDLISYLNIYLDDYPNIIDIVKCIIRGYHDRTKRCKLPYRGNERKKHYKRQCKESRREEHRLMHLVGTDFNDIRLARIIILIYVYDVYLRALPYHINDKLYNELKSINKKIGEYYYKDSIGQEWKLRKRADTFNIARTFGLDVANRVFLYKRLHI